jgi:hypothetical protein
MKKHLIPAVCLLLGALTGAPAQAQQRIPDEVFYLMPTFGEGMIYIRGQGPAQGKLNICAVDNSLRYIDDDGTELAAANADNILQVRIDTVTFIRYQNAFVRLHPVTGDTGIAVKREVRILKDTKVGAYGASSRTSSIKEYNTLYTEGVAIELNKNREYPYSVSETVFVYKGTDVLVPTRNNLRKLFPEKREEVDAWFKANRSFPQDMDEASALLAQWSR